MYAPWGLHCEAHISMLCSCKIPAGSTDSLFAYWVMFHAFFVICLFFSKSTFSNNSIRNTIRVSNSLDPDQTRHFVGPDLGPNCLQRLSADATNRQSYKISLSDHSNQLFNKKLSIRVVHFLIQGTSMA